MPRYSANLSILYPDLDFPARFDAAAKDGFAATECWFPYAHPIPELRAILDGCGLPLIGINTSPGDTAAGEWGLTGLPGREAAFRADFDRALDYATALGVTGIHVMAAMLPAGTPREAALAAYRANLEWALARSEGSGVTLLLEPLNAFDRPGYLINRSDEAMAEIARIDHPRLKLMFDVYHVQRGEGDVLNRLRADFPRIGHIQIAACPSRHEPDEGELDYRAVLAAIDGLGWSGFVGCEYKPRAGTSEGLGWRSRLSPAPRKRLALVAHDRKKTELADWVARHETLFRPHALVATGTTGGVLLERCPSLDITRLKSGPLGGDQQIGAMIAEGTIDALIFFTDPLSPHPHDVDVKALTRLATVYDLPMACSAATASLLVEGGLLGSVR